MYCPRCGQQQVTEETKFCSRCGFPLGLITEILAHGGFLPQLADLYKSKRWLTKRNGVFFSIMWAVFFVFILTPFWAIVNAEELAGISAVIGIFGGLMWLLPSLFFLKSDAEITFPQNQLPNQTVNPLYAANQMHLPPAQSSPANSYIPPAAAWKAPDTGEFAVPHSVAEGTTKLLKKDE